MAKPKPTGKIFLKKTPPARYFIPYVVQALYNLGGKAKIKPLENAVLEDFDYDDSVLGPKGNSGLTRLHLNIRFAATWLKISGHFDNHGGYWRLLEKGKQAFLGEIKRALEEGDEDQTEKFKKEVVSAVTAENQRRKAERDAAKSDGKETPFVSVEAELEKETDEEQKTLDAFLAPIKDMDPENFERLCAELLRRLGCEDVKNTRGKKDGGYDGAGYFCFVSGLVRIKVIFACKRFSKGSVSAKDMREFIGVMQNGTMETSKAHKGVFFTTSRFTKTAQDAANENGNVEMVDGALLVKLLQQAEISAQPADLAKFDTPLHRPS